MSVIGVGLSAALLAGLAVFQALLAMQAPWGRFAWGGQHDRLPAGARIGSLAAIVVYSGILAIQMQQANMLHLLPVGDWVNVAAWAIVVLYGLGIAGNAASRSAAERRVMTPLVSLLFVLAVVVALGL